MSQIRPELLLLPAVHSASPATASAGTPGEAESAGGMDH